LRQTEFENALKYEAISYVWGDPAKEISVLCDGKILVVYAKPQGWLAPTQAQRQIEMI